MCPGLSRSARRPPWIFGWRVFSLPSIISRKAGVIRHIDHRNAAFPQLCRRSARGEDLHAKGPKPLGEFNDPRLVRHTDQYPFDIILLHAALLFILVLL